MNEQVQSGSLPAFTASYPLAFFNGSGEIIPPHALLQIVNSTPVGSERIFTVYKPTGSTTAKYIINGPQSVPIGGYGSATDFYPADCAYGFVAPSAGATCGPFPGSWYISINGKGFISLGGAANGVVRVAAKDGVTSGDDFPLVRIRNDSGVPMFLSQVMGYGFPITPPPDPPRVPTFASTTPTTGRPFVILLNDIAIGGLGDAAPVGVLPVQVDFTDLSHTKADCTTGVITRLKSGESGPATILWRERQHISGGGTFGVQWAFVLLDRETKPEAIRGIVYSTITAATGAPTAAQTPGKGQVKFSQAPTGAIGAAWNPGTNPVEVENWSHASIATDKEVLLRLSRVDSNGNKIYEVLPSGGGASSTIRFARVYSTISAASNNLAASMGGGLVRFQDNSTGVLDNNPSDVDNPLIGVSFVTDAQVEVDTSYNPPRVINGTCNAVSWA